MTAIGPTHAYRIHERLGVVLTMSFARAAK